MMDKLKNAIDMLNLIEIRGERNCVLLAGAIREIKAAMSEEAQHGDQYDE